MMWPDVVNASFEFLGSAAVFHHCWTLHKDKTVKGVSILATVFFSLWGYWNLFYYPHLGQTWSFIAGILLVVANTLWVGMMYYYIRYPHGRHTRHYPGGAESPRGRDSRNY